MTDFKDDTIAAKLMAIYGVETFDGMPLQSEPMRVLQLLDDAVGGMRDAFRAAMDEIGKLHTSQIEGWEGEVKQIEGERDGVVAQLELANHTVESLTDSIERYRVTAAENERSAKDWKALAEARSKEIDNLRTDLHGLTVDNARLEGMLDGVARFGPMTEREAMQIERGQNTATDLQGESPSFSASRAAEFLYKDTAAAKAPEPWYRRRAR